MKGPDVLKLVLSLVACQAAGFLGSLATTPSIPNWYKSLAKPSFTPPSWVFGPAWITLYLMMGVALFLVWRKGLSAPGVKTALILFFVQLALNSLWSVLFFGLHQPFWAFVEIVVLWVFILLTLIAFWRISLPAGLLLVPYLLWVTFASALNFAIWRLN
ncbi:MAG: tryptophan-rich sensory protein [Candidatus Aminicenantes bacterium]|nr:tryptophan-rich sensory protein [Candidatus Aminicenantes bacterium]